MRSLVVYLMLLLTTTAAAQQPLEIDSNRVVGITGRINNLTGESQRLLLLSNQDSAPITIVIDSNGGSVIAGLEFYRAMDRVKSRGVELRCVVVGHAMSMAMHILGNCSTRYALPTSLLMWHPAYVSGYMKLDEDKAKRYGDQLKLLTRYLERRLRRALRLRRSVYRKHYKGEYIMLAADLKRLTPKFLTVISDVRSK